MARTAGIILIGNEILSGKVVDANASYLCRELRALGVAVRKISVIPDEVELIASEVGEQSSAFDVVFTSGGVGPTHDDVTMEGVARALGVAVLRDPRLVRLLEGLYKGRLNEARLKMAEVPEGALLMAGEELVGRGLMGRGGRIYAMTSSGGARVLPHYGPVSAAKAALESNIRQLAAELAPLGIAANSIRAGVTDTPALQKIPGSDAIKAGAARRNPSGRLTTTEDVARAIVALSHPDTHWMTGNVIGVDGGEEIVG